eukprot:scaffold92237_cov60-Phaeocystis_antarctica.AAC.3
MSSTRVSGVRLRLRLRVAAGDADLAPGLRQPARLAMSVAVVAGVLLDVGTWLGLGLGDLYLHTDPHARIRPSRSWPRTRPSPRSSVTATSARTCRCPRATTPRRVTTAWTRWRPWPAD